MAKVAGASVSREIHVPDETWMSSIVHFLNNMMKKVITNYCRTEILQVVLLEFCSMKKPLRMPTELVGNICYRKDIDCCKNQKLDLELIAKLLKGS